MRAISRSFSRPGPMQYCLVHLGKRIESGELAWVPCAKGLINHRCYNKEQYPRPLHLTPIL